MISIENVKRIGQKVYSNYKKVGKISPVDVHFFKKNS